MKEIVMSGEFQGPDFEQNIADSKNRLQSENLLGDFEKIAKKEDEAGPESVLESNDQMDHIFDSAESLSELYNILDIIGQLKSSDGVSYSSEYWIKTLRSVEHAVTVKHDYEPSVFNCLTRNGNLRENARRLVFLKLKEGDSSNNHMIEAENSIPENFNGITTLPELFDALYAMGGLETISGEYRSASFWIERIKRNHFKYVHNLGELRWDDITSNNNLRYVAKNIIDRNKRLD